MKKPFNNYESHAWAEFRAAGWVDDRNHFRDEMQEAICVHVLELLNVFHNEGHSGSSAPYTINLFSKLASFKPIAPLTGEDWEWSHAYDHSDNGPTYQNKRCGSVFKDNNGAYDIDGIVFWDWCKDEDGKMFKSYFTSYESKVPVTFPYAKPDKPQYQFRPTEEYPNEVL
jgi:hypothetical protein